MSDKMIVTPDSPAVKAENYCKEFNIRTQAEAEKALSNVDSLYRQSSRFYGDYGNDPELDVYYNQLDADFAAQEFKQTAQNAVEKFKSGEFPKPEWDEEKEEEDNHPQPNDALPVKARDDSPSGTGNTLGKIVGQAPQGANPPHEANAAVIPETAQEKGIWNGLKKMAGELGDAAVDKAKQTGQDLATPEGWDQVEQAKGVGKAASNAGVGMAEMAIKGGMLNSSREAEESARALDFWGKVFGNKEAEKHAEVIGEIADAGRTNANAFNLDEYKMTLDTPGQRLGDLVFEIGTFFSPKSVASAMGAMSKTSTVTKMAEAGAIGAVAKKTTSATKAAETGGAGAKVKGKSTDTPEAKPQKEPVKDDATPSNKKDGNDNGLSTKEGDPVDMATGDFLQVWPVLAIPGLLPLNLNRTYRSTANLHGLFGPKWADDWSLQLVIAQGEVHYTHTDGVVYDFATPDNKVLSRNRHLPHCLLTGELTGELYLTDRRSQLTYHFSEASGSTRKLSAITDRRQNRIDFIYDKHARLIKVERHDSLRLILHYHQNGQLHTLDMQEIRDDQTIEQRLLTCQYDSHGYLSECDAFQHNHLWHEYDQQGRMTRWHDTDQTDLTITYDERGRVLSTTSPSGYWHDRFRYDDHARITTYLDGEGGETRYHYDPNGLVIREVDPLGRITRRQWRGSLLMWESDPLGQMTAFEYNPDGALTEVKLPTGDTFAYDYDEHGQLTESTLPTGERWQWHYDEQGNLTALTNPLGHKEEYQYGLHGELRQRLLPDGRQWHYAYDEHQRLAAVMTPDGETTGLELDALGRLRRFTDALKQETRYQYSPDHASLINGSLNEITLADGVTQKLEYDSEHRIATVTDGEGRTTRYTYGAFDLLTQVTRPDGTTLRFGYDRLTRLNSVIASTGETYRYERDAAGQIIRETDFTGRTLTYQYDKLGRRTHTLYPDGQQLRWHYSAAGLLLKQESWQPAENQLVLKDTTTYAYNQRYQLVKATNADAIVEYEYDKTTGLSTCERINGREIIREWDTLTGRPVSESVDGNTLHFGYNPMGALNHFQLNQHAPLTFQHDVLGRETVRESANGFILASRYTATGLLAHQSAGQATQFFRETLAQNDPYFPPQATAVNRSWQYDRAHNVRVIDDSRWGQTRYRYNANDQILSTLFDGNRPHEEQFSYDANGNLSQHLPVDAYGAMEQITQRQKAGRVVQQGDIRYRYDDNGRLVEKTEQRDGFRPQVWRYRWNTQNQLTHCETPDGSRWHYQYDAFGRRIRKLKVHDGKLTATNLQRWLDGKPDLTPRTDAIMGQDYLWSGDQLIEETPIYADGSLALDSRVRWLYEPGALTPSARVEKGKLHYIISDHQGTPREMLNENGTLVWAQRLKTWGKAEKSQVLASNDADYHVGCNFRFCGQYEDQESGLFYNRHRYYSPETAQYISADPIGLVGGFNPYGYVHNPSKFVDPFGLSGTSNISNAPPDPYQGVRDASEYLNSMGVDRVRRKQIIDSFDLSGMSVQKAGNNLYGSRFHDFGKTARPEGQYVFETFTPYTNRSGLALPPDWNGMTGIKQFQITPGTTIIRGRAAPQYDFGPQYSGGAEQIFVLEPWKYGSLK